MGGNLRQGVRASQTGFVKIKSGAATIKNSSQLAGSGAVETSGMLLLTVFQVWVLMGFVFFVPST